MKIRCIAVDDEPLAIEQIKDFIEKIPFLELIATFQKGMDAMCFLKSNAIDLMFLDIQMEDISGIQMLQILKEKPNVIISTAFDDYAIKGFDLDVTDYLVKPLSFERFVKAVNKVYDFLLLMQSPEKPTNESKNQEQQDFIFIKADYLMQKVLFDEVLFIEGYKDYLKFQLIHKYLLTLMSFKRLTELLPSNKFIRVHKSYIISLDKIDTIGKNSIKIKEHQIPIGEFYKEAFFDYLQKLNLY
jgi:two-component system, LytTR family, response regulator